MRQRLEKLPAEPTPAPGAQVAQPQIPSATELYEMIAEAAYHRAEKRGFTPGLEAEDWLQAEAEVMERMRALRG